jgi:DNA-binding MarR family transcriptional regulator
VFQSTKEFLVKDNSYRADESLGYATITAYRLMNAALRRKFRKSDIDLTPEEWGVLVLLWEKGSAAQEELAAALCIDKSAMSRVLSVMQDKGLIDRDRDPDNERKKIIRAAERSQLVRERGFRLAGDALKNALDGVSPEEAAICIQVLHAVRRNLRNKHG